MLDLIWTLVCEFLCHVWWVMGVLRTVLPGWIEAAGVSAALFYGTRLRKPSAEDVKALFGERARCIGHRGASLDAPENTIAAFKYCINNGCDFVEFDVRSCGDGTLVLSHDADLRRVAGTTAPAVAAASWDTLCTYDVAGTHPDREKFGATYICRFNDALDFLLEHNMRMIIDVKGDDKEVIDGVVNEFALRPQLFSRAAVTTFNPVVLYKIRRREPRIVGAISYRPYGLSHGSYDATHGPSQPRFGGQPPLQLAARAADAAAARLWRAAADWCRVSAVFLHKDMVSPDEVSYWRSRGVHTVGWSVNRPLEKLYWRGVLGASYLASTLVGEPPAAGLEKKPSTYEATLAAEDARAGGRVIDELLREKSK